MKSQIVPNKPHTFTRISEVDYDTIYVCNDCGGIGSTVEMVDHYPSCVPGASVAEEEANNARDFEQEKLDDLAYLEK